jgi:hypothetical protein
MGAWPILRHGVAPPGNARRSTTGGQNPPETSVDILRGEITSKRTRFVRGNYRPHALRGAPSVGCYRMNGANSMGADRLVPAPNCDPAVQYASSASIADRTCYSHPFRINMAQMAAAFAGFPVGRWKPAFSPSRSRSSRRLPPLRSLSASSCFTRSPGTGRP